MAAITPYELRQTIAVHQNDVRALCYANKDDLITASRDNTVKLTKADGTSEELVKGTSFYNACTINSDKSVVFVGNLRGEITAIPLTGDSARVAQLYGGHLKNVTSLSVIRTADNTDRLVSASWDNTVRVWESPTNVKTLVGHTQYVWDAKFVDENHVLSASADKTIRLWDVRTGAVLKTLTGHTDVVRALLVLSSSEALSASNDETIIKWDLNSGKPLATWRGHLSFVYSLAQLTPELVVSSSEDHTVRIWNIHTGETVQTITLPSISQWCVASNQYSEFAVGSSDSTARIFTPHADRQSSLEERQAFEEAVKLSETKSDEGSSSENGLKESQVKDPSVLQSPPTSEDEGKVIFVRNAQDRNQIEAHKATNGSWELLGEVVNPDTQGAKPASSAEKSDYTFDVDIADDQPPLKLHYNRSDNPYIVAEKFVADNNLPASYVEQVVKFLISNTDSQQLAAAAPSAAGAPSAGVSASTSTADATEIPSALRHSQPVYIKAFQADPLLRALNSSASGSGEDLGHYEIDSLLSSLPSSADELLRTAIELCKKWQGAGDAQKMLPALDLLRIALADAQNIPYDAVWMQLLSALDAQVPKHCMLAVRGLANLVGNPAYPTTVRSVNSNLANALNMIITDVASQIPDSFAKPLATALATLDLNLAIKAIPSIEIHSLIEATAQKIVNSGDPEASYRVALAIGLCSVAGEGSTYKASWFTNAPAEQRLTELLDIVRPRIG